MDIMTNRHKGLDIHVHVSCSRRQLGSVAKTPDDWYLTKVSVRGYGVFSRG